MKIFITLLLFTTSLYAKNQDSLIAKENINRILNLVDHYNNEIKPILIRYKKERNLILNRLERKTLDDFWTIYIDSRIILNTLMETSSLDPLVKYACNLHLQYSAVVLSYDLWDNEKARKKLNETNQSEIPKGSFISL